MDLDQLQESLVGQDAVIHLAGVPGPGRASSQEMLEINVVGTAHVLEGAVRSGVDKVVLASSGAATGFSFQTHEIAPRYLPIDEDHPCQPQDEYGLSKLLAEITCKRYSDAYGLRTICLRINNSWYLKREEAEVATQSGWAKGLTVEELWTGRYRKTIEDNPDVEWPVPGPPSPHKILWAFTDARDAAEAFRLAAENEDIIHEVFLINGYDTCARIETPQLLARHYPEIPLKTPLMGHDSLWSHGKATRMIGYQPQYTWRQSDFSDWLANITRGTGHP
jgi:nucleoside-diphosphate-sugar epimerase